MAATCGKGLEPYKDSTKPVETRVMDLLGRMTMEEIANSEGTVKSAVKKSLEQALAKLRKYFI